MWVFVALQLQVPLPPGCPVLLDVLFAQHTPMSSSSNCSGSGSDCNAATDEPHEQQQQQQQQQVDRRVLHVQSISGWAPSCIGPYSQVRRLTHSLAAGHPMQALRTASALASLPILYHSCTLLPSCTLDAGHICVALSLGTACLAPVSADPQLQDAFGAVEPPPLVVTRGVDQFITLPGSTVLARYSQTRLRVAHKGSEPQNQQHDVMPKC